MTVSAAQTNYADRAAAIYGSSSKTPVAATQEMSDRFLKLLVTQLKNQDPMNPMDNAELTMQLAQMSTVEGVNKLNQSLEVLNSQYRASQVLQGASLVGRQVLAEGSSLVLSDSAAVAGFELASKADSVKVGIYDQAGSLVRTVDLGKQDAGLVRFTWDGANDSGAVLADGTFTYQVQATASGKDVGTTRYTLGQVLSVAMNGDAMDVEVSGLGNRALGQIRQIF